MSDLLREKTILARAGLGNPGNTYAGPDQNRTTSVLFENTASMRERQSKLWESRNVAPYSANLGSPISHHLEDVINEMEGGAGCIALPTGQAAIAVALNGFLTPHCQVLMPDNAYGVMRQFLNEYFKGLRIEVKCYDPTDLSSLEQVINNEKAKILYVEAPGSLTFEIPDLDAIFALAKKHGLKTICDNTWATPLGYKPLAHGADVSIQSVSKMLSGHGDVFMGTVTTKSVEDYVELRKFAAFYGYYVDSEPCRRVLNNIESLPERLAQSSSNALAVINAIQADNHIQSIYYPAWEKDEYFTGWKQQFTAPAPGLLNIAFKKECGPRFRENFVDALKLFNLGVGWGGKTSLSWLVDPVRNFASNRGGPGVRLYAGYEDERDLVADVQQAIQAASRKMVPA